MSAARARPGNGRDFDEESNATNAKDGRGLQGISGRVGNPQASTGAPTKWDDKKAAYVAAHGATHHAAHGRGDRQGLPVLRRCLVRPRRKISRGKPDSAEALPIFFQPKNASTKKRLLSPMASVGGPILIVKGCRQCLVLPRRKIFRIASNDEFVSKERGHNPMTTRQREPRPAGCAKWLHRPGVGRPPAQDAQQTACLSGLSRATTMQLQPPRDDWMATQDARRVLRPWEQPPKHG
jgi:hypothetical protein